MLYVDYRIAKNDAKGYSKAKPWRTKDDGSASGPGSRGDVSFCITVSPFELLAGFSVHGLGV